jgi:hypothetical protein
MNGTCMCATAHLAMKQLNPVICLVNGVLTVTATVTSDATQFADEIQLNISVTVMSRCASHTNWAKMIFHQTFFLFHLTTTHIMGILI